MTAREFFDKVVALRVNQKGFFSTTKGDPMHSHYYSESKRLEGEIDKEIERVQSIINSENNLT